MGNPQCVLGVRGDSGDLRVEFLFGDGDLRDFRFGDRISSRIFIKNLPMALHPGSLQCLHSPS